MRKFLHTFQSEAKIVLKRSFSIYLELLKLIVPVTLVVKLLSELGLIQIIGSWIRPLMDLVGLPGEMGLVWATGLVTSPYGAIIAYSEISQNVPLTIAQVTVLSGMILIAHNLIVEVSIGKKIGVSIAFQLILRFLSAFLFGFLLFQTYKLFPFFQSSAVSIWSNNGQKETLLSWLISTSKNYAMMYLIMTSLLTIMHILERINLLDTLYSIFEPFLNYFGMSKQAAPITLIGMTLGLAVGGGLMIDEAKKGNLSRKDIFLVLSLMCLLHSLIEDTIVMTTIGASISGILIGRFIFTFVIFLFISRSHWIQHLLVPQEMNQI
jgi:hypothetical protein